MPERVIRKVFPREDGMVEDLLAVIVHNDTPLPIPVIARDFFYTDALSIQHLAFRQDVTRCPDWDRFDDGPGRVRYRLRPTTTIVEPGQHHVLAARVLRGGCLSAVDGDVTFQDSILDFASTGTTNLEATVVFPERLMRMEVAATSALTTSRTATWSRGLVAVTQCVATHRRARLSGAPQMLDNATAELHRLVMAVLSNEWLSLADYGRFTQQMPGFDPKVLSDEEFRGLPWPARIDWIERQLELCRTVRQGVFAHAVSLPIGNEQDLAEYASRAIERQHPAHEFLPTDLWAALESLSRYLLEQRKKPNEWPDELEESHLQQHLSTFLSGRGPIESEVQSSRGRVDLMLGTTPVELKCRELGPTSNVEPHLQQAAQYATSRGKSVGCLVILDKSQPSTSNHEPHPSADVTVHQVTPASAGGVVRPTLVVAFVIRARSTSPSRLGGGSAAKRATK